MGNCLKRKKRYDNLQQQQIDGLAKDMNAQTSEDVEENEDKIKEINEKIVKLKNELKENYCENVKGSSFKMSIKIKR